MNNLRTVALVIIIFLIGVLAIYWIYKTQVATNSDNLLPMPSPGTGFEISSPSPSPSPTSAKGPVPSIQPQSGTDTLDVKNEGIIVSSPNASSIITSPVTVSGLANVLGGKVNVNIKDANGNILGSSQAEACFGYDACQFETTITFKPSSTSAGIIEAYSVASNGSQKYLQQLLVRF